MKKNFFIIVVCILVLLGLSGCGKEEFSEEEEQLVFEDLGDLIYNPEYEAEMDDSDEEDYGIQEEMYDDTVSLGDESGGENNQKSLKQMIASSQTLVVSKMTLFTTIPSPTGAGTVYHQGGYTDGHYFYQAVITKKDTANNEKNNEVVIVKYDLTKKEVVAQSDALRLGHANDITYNSKLGYFVVCNNKPNQKTVSFIDSGNLSLVKTRNLDYSIYSIDYNATYDRYVVGISGGQTFRILDADFNTVGGPYEPTTRTEGYTRQGVSCDEDYIYFLLYDSNAITVYDWNGKFVTLIELNVEGEPENISVVNDKIYVMVANNGAKLYVLDEFEAR